MQAAVAKTPAKAPPAARKVTFRILRGTLVGDQLTQKNQDFEVPYDDSTTVLGALEWVKGELDGSLTFRRSCRASICGSCGMYINGRSRLACKTKVKDLIYGNEAKNIAAGGEVVVISPQLNQPVLKDLVVDIHPFYEKVEVLKPYVQDGPEKEAHVTKDSFSQVNMVSNCIMCGNCYSDCTAMVENPSFLGPAALAKAYRFVADPREGDKTDRLKALSEDNGVWDCTRCGMCIDACPKGVAPMEAIVKLRALAIEAGNTHVKGAKKSMGLKGEIATWGVVNEPLMMLNALGPIGVLGQLGNALNLMKKGKVPSPLPFEHRPEGLAEVKAIYKELEENPLDVRTRAEDSGPGAG
ncbi:MAG: 4Fe-4S dicluster domain-containing protein [Proteobacteria bacterium]|nr:4Fe-4S dicluster domain-containing protein [Pseudomonadota bacterium]